MDVLYRDPNLLVVNKPSGLITHRGWANDRDNALARAREIAGCYVYPAHRLDRATSGVLLFALCSEVAAVLGQQLDAGGFRKQYLALVRGIAPDTADIDHPIAKEPLAERRPARTLVARLGTFERYSLVRAEPLTGRLHQIRRHLKHLSHPVLGDTRYGHGEHNRACRERFGLHRLALHAARLEIVHPVSGEPLQLCAALPVDLARPLETMGLLDLAQQAIALPAAHRL